MDLDKTHIYLKHSKSSPTNMTLGGDYEDLSDTFEFIKKDENHSFLTFLTFCAPFLSLSHLFLTYISYVPEINKSLN